MGNTYKKLIYADEAFRILSDYYHHRTETQADALREALDRVPEAVVRCGECKWWNEEHYQGKHDTLNYCENWENLSWKNDYCSYGERRTDEAD